MGPMGHNVPSNKKIIYEIDLFAKEKSSKLTSKAGFFRFSYISPKFPAKIDKTDNGTNGTLCSLVKEKKNQISLLATEKSQQMASKDDFRY